ARHHQSRGLRRTACESARAALRAPVERPTQVAGYSRDDRRPDRRDAALPSLWPQEGRPRVICRYTMLERAIHWLAALTYVYVLLTGLAFYSPHLYWIAAILGGAPTSRFWHPWVALVFLASLVWMWRAWRSDMRITAVDRRWGKAVDHYIR